MCDLSGRHCVLMLLMRSIFWKCRSLVKDERLSSSILRKTIGCGFDFRLGLRNRFSEDRA